jgi:hypothetical protein
MFVLFFFGEDAMNATLKKLIKKHKKKKQKMSAGETVGWVFFGILMNIKYIYI